MCPLLYTNTNNIKDLPIALRKEHTLPRLALELRCVTSLEIAEALIKSSVIDVIIVDSVAALVPRTEIDEEMGDSHVGLHARLMSQGMRKLVELIKKVHCTVIFINQLREKVGVMFGTPETTGGRALKFYSSVRLDVRKDESIKIQRRSCRKQNKS